MSGHKYIYQDITSNIRDAIHQGALKTGEKLKSVRAMSNELGVSSATVFKAYYELESAGLIEARPKSGYYVKFHLKAHALPKNQHFTDTVTNVSNQKLIGEFLTSQADQSIVNLGTSVPSPALLPLGKIKKSIQKCYLNDPLAQISYQDSSGNPELRRQIAQLALGWGGVYTTDDVLITNGCMEAVALSLYTITKPGDTIIVESPIYYGLLQLVDTLQLNVIEIPVDAETGISLNYLAQTLRTHTVRAMLLVPNFSNPTGVIMPEDHKRQLVELATAHSVPIIEDDIYGDLYFTASRPKTLKSFDKQGWVIYCSSFSKTLLPGYRIGWCMPGRFGVEIRQRKFVSNIATSSIGQAITSHFLTNGRYEFHLKKLRSALKTQHIQYKRAIYDYFPGKIACTNPKGGFALWLQLPGTKNALDLYRKALDAGVRITPGQLFFARANQQTYFRICYGEPFSESIDTAIKTLGKVAATL